MPVSLNHTIVKSKDSQASALFMSEILGLPSPAQFGPFQIVEATNGVSLDFMETTESITPQHYAFLVSEADFDAIFSRIQERRLLYWADPQGTQPDQINHRDGGRGLYFEDPNGHYLEILTRPYGS